jgi:hypothetical protein
MVEAFPQCVLEVGRRQDRGVSLYDETMRGIREGVSGVVLRVDGTTDGHIIVGRGTHVANTKLMGVRVERDVVDGYAPLLTDYTTAHPSLERVFLKTNGGGNITLFDVASVLYASGAEMHRFTAIAPISQARQLRDFRDLVKLASPSHRLASLLELRHDDVWYGADTCRDVSRMGIDGVALSSELVLMYGGEERFHTLFHCLREHGMRSMVYNAGSTVDIKALGKLQPDFIGTWNVGNFMNAISGEHFDNTIITTSGSHVATLII